MSKQQTELLPNLEVVISLLTKANPGIVVEIPRLRLAAERGWLKGVRPIRAMIDAGLLITDIEQAVWASKGFEYIGQLPDLVSADLVERIHRGSVLLRSNSPKRDESPNLRTS